MLSITWANFIDQLDWRGTNKDISLITVGFLIYPLREAFIYQCGTIGFVFSKNYPVWKHQWTWQQEQMPSTDWGFYGWFQWF